MKKTETDVLIEFTEDLVSKKTVKEVSVSLKKPYPLVHRVIKELIKKDYLLKDEHNLISINLRNYSELSYIEGIKAREFLKKKKNFVEILENIKEGFFVFVVSGKEVFVISDESVNVPKDVKVISGKDAAEMLSRKDDNIMNKSLGEKVILFGAENYYRIVENAR